MKNTNSIQINNLQLDPLMEQKLGKAHAENLTWTQNFAKHLAKRTLPASKEDSLVKYTGEIKARYEKLAAMKSQHFQPDLHLPEFKLDAEHFQSRNREIKQEVSDMQREIQEDQYELGNFSPSGLWTRIIIALVASGIILGGEIAFNIKAFQVIGENLLISLVLSVVASFAVFVFSHMIPFALKGINSIWKRWLVVILSLLFIIMLFIALAIFRTQYLGATGVELNPFYFVVINLFLFVVATLLSFFMLPTWAEIKANTFKLIIHRRIKKRQLTIAKLKNEQSQIQDKLLQLTRERFRLTSIAKYCLKTIEKMYQEAVAVFKSTNLNFRKDGQCPECFQDPVSKMEIDEQINSLLKLQSK